MAAGGTRQPLFSYLAILALGLIPTAVVTHYYGILPQRLVIQWDTFGNITVIGTKPRTVLMIANVAAVVALTAIAVSIWQHRTLLQLGLRRAFLGLNFAQIVAINLVCAMLVSDALGLRLTLKPMIPPAMAVLLFAAGILFWRMQQGQANAVVRAVAMALIGGSLVLLAFSAVAVNAVVGYFASALALLAMAALALPQER
ncbi:MAG: hypothetical protein SGI91_21995 [Alphaproteobacteria bacterium]|nr:hypothetical protein [Alphaproteobacteria bacterium]